MNVEVKRLEYLDVLRVVAAFAVIVLHLAGYKEQYEPGSFQWWGGIIYNALSRWGVPSFVMISGTLFIGREIPLKKLYGKYILRILVAYVFWNSVYALITDPNATPAGWVMDIVLGAYHMWFLYMIVGLYISQPILNLIARSKRGTEYFIVIAFITSFLFPQMIAIAKLSPYSVQFFGGIISIINSKLRLELFGGFATYFLLGYYLRVYELSKKVRWLIYLGGLFGMCVTVVCYGALCLKLQINNEVFLDNLSVNVFLMSIAIFLFMKEHGTRVTLFLPERLINTLSNRSFGIYLIHAFILRIVSPVTNAVTDVLSSFVAIPLMAIVVFSISLVCVCILKKVPIAQKYIV